MTVIDDAGAEWTRRSYLSEQVVALGARWSPEVLAGTNAIYEDKVEIDSPEVERIADLPYGEHPRQRLDAYVPQSGNAPVLLFVPGGGFTGGGKDEHPSFYRNVGVYFPKHGFLTFIANYRLAPEFRWAEQTSDAGAAIEWVSANAHKYDSNRKGVALIGHSAGAVNVAGYLVHPRYDGRACTAGVLKAALISGVYDFTREAPLNVQMYAGEPSAWSDRSPITHIGRCSVPLALCAAEFDPAELVRPTLDLASALTGIIGHCPPLHVLGGHNHVSTVRSIGSPDGSVGALLLSFIR